MIFALSPFFCFGSNDHHDGHRYLLQGNVRFVGVQSALGRMEARAVLRLLLRADIMTPVLFMDEIYYSSHRDDELESQASL